MFKQPINESNIKDVARSLFNAKTLGQSQVLHSGLLLLLGQLDPHRTELYEFLLIGWRQVRVRCEHSLHVIKQRVSVLVFIKKHELLLELLLSELMDTVRLQPVEKGVKSDSFAPWVPTEQILDNLCVVVLRDKLHSNRVNILAELIIGQGVFLVSVKGLKYGLQLALELLVD